MPARVVVALEGRQLVLGSTEDVGVLVTDGVEDLYVGAVEGTHGQCTVHHELHVGGARSFLTGHGDLLRDVRSRNDVLGGGDVVVVNEDHLDGFVYVAVVVNQLSNGVDELDDGLGADVTGGSLSAEDEYALGYLQARVLLHAEVQVQDVEGVEQLTLVLVQTLDLYVVDGLRVNLDAFTLSDPVGEVSLVGGLDFA